MPIPPRLQEILDDLDVFPDRHSRIEALISLAEGFRNPAEEGVPRTLDTRVPGCESEVYLVAKPAGSGVKFHFAVDNPQGISAMAMAQILDRGLGGASLQEIQDIPEDIPFLIFGTELSMGKSMGLTGMVRMVKKAAKEVMESEKKS